MRDDRDHLRDLAATAPLQDLARAWRGAERVRQWALDLCTRVEEELAAGQLGEAAGEWQKSRYAMAGRALLSTLKQRDWPLAQHALDTLLMLYQLDEFQRLDHLVPGCQWHLLDTEGLRRRFLWLGCGVDGFREAQLVQQRVEQLLHEGLPRT